MKTHSARRIVLSLIVATALAASLFSVHTRDEKSLKAVVLDPSNTMFNDTESFSANDVKKLAGKVDLDPISVTQGFAEEPPLLSGIEGPDDAETIGVGKSPLLVDSRWATIRYLGEAPAGAGLHGDAFNQAQLSAFGTRNDSIPVTTAALTINKMMNDFYAPLLSTLPTLGDLLPYIKVQGAYFSPDYKSFNGAAVGRDNAFVVGLQSLYLFPNSCFDKTKGVTGCKEPFFSTGHDPTVVGHELGHVIFNHVRHKKGLDGFQWFAVNEGYADYFSASYFSEPVLGRIWRVTRAGTPYLRSLLDHPLVSDPSVAQDAHLFSVIWSSALWRARDRLQKEKSASKKDIDRVVLMSISFLGETQKPRLGDCATAVLKAAEILGFPEWKEIYREEFSRGEISYEPQQSVRVSSADPDIPLNPSAQCGVIATSNTGKTHTTALLLLLLPCLVGLKLKRGTRQVKVTKKSYFVVLPFLSGCNLMLSLQNGNARAPGQTVRYSCSLGAIASDSALNKGESSSTVILTLVKDDAEYSHIMVSDERFERSDAAVVFIVDKVKHHVDQVRKRDGTPFEGELVAKDVSEDVALSYQHVRVGSFLLDSAVPALASASSAILSSASGVTFQFDSRNFLVSHGVVSNSGFSYGPLPNSIERDGITVCGVQ